MRQKPTDDGKNEPSLKLPSLSLPALGRGRKKTHPEVSPQMSPEPETPRESADQSQGPLKVAAEPSAGRRARVAVSLPTIPGRVAVIVTGLVVGVVGTLLTYLALAGCEAVKGTSSCGGPGLFLLVAILAVMTLVGTVILKAWSVSDPGSTSFLAVGIVTVVVLVAMLDVIFSAWTFLLVPVVSAASYLGAHWVTSRTLDEAGGAPYDRHDAR